MKKCEYCGRENTDEAEYCCGCGSSEFVALTVPTALAEQEKIESTEESPELISDVPPGGESALCTYCLFPNLPDAFWCKRCGASVSFSSIVGPVDAAYASGFMWRGALRGRPKPFVFFSVWFLFLPRFVFALMTLWIVVADGLYDLYGGVVFCTAIGISFLEGAMLYQITRNYLTIPKLNLDVTAD